MTKIMFLLYNKHSFVFVPLFHSSFSSAQYIGSRVTPACRMRRCECLIHCRRWRLWQTRCPSFRASCRPARTCALSGMRYFICQGKLKLLSPLISEENVHSMSFMNICYNKLLRVLFNIEKAEKRRFQHSYMIKTLSQLSSICLFFRCTVR